MELLFTEHELAEVAAKIISHAPSKTLCFFGPMGAGKTTLIKAIVKELGGTDMGSSPTFGIVNEYEHKDGGVLAYHFDFYRIENETEALDLGFEEYLDQNTWVFIEWPERIEGLLPEDCTRLTLAIIDKDTRRLHL